MRLTKKMLSFDKIQPSQNKQDHSMQTKDKQFVDEEALS